MIDYHKVTKIYSISQLIINYLRALITLFLIHFKTASKVTHYDSDDRVDSVTRMEYDSNGELISYRTRNRSTSDFELTYRNEYDSCGNHILKYNISEGTATKYIYDNNRNIIESVFYDANGRVEGGRRLNYDIEGNLISIQENGHLLKQYHYNFKGQVDRAVVFDPNNNKHEYTYNYQYDSKNNWIRQEIYKDGSIDEYIERMIVYL